MKRMIAADREFYTVLSQIVDVQIARLTYALQSEVVNGYSTQRLGSNDELTRVPP